MRSLIIYFSQTGFTRQAAEQIREGILSTENECELIALRDVDVYSLLDYDLVGLGCPVHYYDATRNVSDFIERLPELRDRHWFVFCTHGSVMGITLLTMSERLQRKGAVVVGYYDMYADGRAAFAPYPTLTTGHPDAIDLETAHAFGREVVERTQAIADGDESLIPEPAPVDEKWIRAAKSTTPELQHQIIPRFEVDLERCTQCLECQNNCPVDGIDMETDPPRLQDPCIFCCYCVNVCPECAIDGDWTIMESSNRPHYAALRKALDKAEAQGTFRYLMDPDSLDFDDVLHKQWKRERMK